MNSAFSRDTFLDTQVAFSGFPHIPGTCTAFLHVVGLCYFGYLVIKLCVYILQMLLKFQIFLGHLPGRGVVFLGFGTSYRCSKNSTFSWDIYPDTGFFFWVFRTLHHADAPDFLGTFTQTQGLFFSVILYTTSSSCSSISWDIYTDLGVVFFRVFRTLHHPDAPVSLGTFTWTWWFFFSGLSAHYIMQMLQFCLEHLPGHGTWFFRDFHTLHHPDAPAFLGTFTQTWGLFFFRVFRTVHHADALDFLGTFTWTQGLFFSGFLDTTSCRCSGFS